MALNPNLPRLVLFRKLQSVCCLVATCSFVRSNKNICNLEGMGSRAANSVSTQQIIVARLADVALQMNANNAKARTVTKKKRHSDPDVWKMRVPGGNSWQRD